MHSDYELTAGEQVRKNREELQGVARALGRLESSTWSLSNLF